MKKLISVLVFLLAIAIISTGCSTLETTGGRTEISATGGPGAILSMLSDIRMNGSLQTTPGGFTLRNEEAGIGAISNEERGASKDVDIYIRDSSSYGRDEYVIYSGPAEVQTPSWIKVYNEETRRWNKVKTKRWITIYGLESIHFESPLVQRVTLRGKLSPSDKIREIKFDTYGRRQYGSTYERINILFIKLPRADYRLEVYSYTGKSIFKSARGYPYTRSIYMDDDPVDTQVGNTWIGWKERL